MILFQGKTKQTYRGAAVAVSGAAVLAVLGLQGPAGDASARAASYSNQLTASVVSTQDSMQAPADDAKQRGLDRACLSGTALPIGQPVSLQARLAACSQRIESASGRDRVMKVLDRARLLHFNGTETAHKQQAYLDFSLAIAFGIEQPSIFAARGKLNHMLRRNPEAAIEDYDKAIMLTNGAALPSYYLERAKCKVALASKKNDALIFGSALQDVDVYLTAFPGSEDAVNMRRWLVEKTEPLLTQYVQPATG